MQKHLLALAAAAALLAAAPAHAISFNGVMGGDSDVVDYSADGLLSFDINFTSRSPMTLNYTIDAADIAGGNLAFNAVLNNFVGAGIPGYRFSLSAGQFNNIGTATGDWTGTGNIQFGGAMAAVSFSDLETIAGVIGNARGDGGLDWSIRGLNAGDSLSITVTAVPEPETYAMLFAGLGVVGWLAKRRKQVA